MSSPVERGMSRAKIPTRGGTPLSPAGTRMGRMAVRLSVTESTFWTTILWFLGMNG